MELCFKEQFLSISNLSGGIKNTDFAIEVHIGATGHITYASSEIKRKKLLQVTNIKSNDTLEVVFSCYRCAYQQLLFFNIPENSSNKNIILHVPCICPILLKSFLNFLNEFTFRCFCIFNLRLVNL